MDAERTAELPGLRATAMFLGLALLFEGALAVVIPASAKSAMCVATSTVAGSLIRVMGVPVSVFGAEIFLPSRMLAIDLECTAIYLVGIFAALTLSYPASWRDKLVGIAIGIPVVIAGNLLRLMLVAGVSESWPSVFDFTHDLLFQVALVLWVLATWGAWIVWTRNRAA